MALPAFREELISRVDPENVGHSPGREEYRRLMEAIGPEIAGRKALVRDLAIRIVKGTQRLHLPAARITTQGLATEDEALIDCRAAIVRFDPGAIENREYLYRRYSGKDSAHPTRIFPSYDPATKRFTLEAPDSPGGPSASFHAAHLLARRGLVHARFGNDIVEGALENGALTEHIRACLAHVEKKVGDLHVLLPHPWFRRASDTRQEPHPRISTLYTDGAQIHVMNENSPRGPQEMDAFRAGMVLGGPDFPAYIEDLAHEARIVTDAGEKPLFFQSLTPRCLVTQRDVRTGAVSGAPKQWLRTHRPLRPWDDVATMGANVDAPPHGEDSVVRLGAEVTLVSEKTQWRQ